MNKNLLLFICFFLTVLSSKSQTLTAIAPSTGTAGTTVTAILTGQNTFFMSSSPQGIQFFQLHKGFCRTLNGTNFVTLNNDSVRVDIPIPAGYVNGVYNVYVWTGAGQALGIPSSFTITGGVDQSIQGFSPSSAVEASTVNAQITGQNLQTIAGMPGFHIEIQKGNRNYPGVNINVIGPGQINADFFVPAFADTGYYDCRITVNGNCFILPNALHVTGVNPKQLVSITPASGNAGNTLTALVTGQNTFFMSSSPQGIQSIKLENANCNLYYGTSISIVDNDHVNVDYTFPSDASNGQYDLTVKYLAGPQLILPAAFTINTGVSRDVTSFFPDTATAGTTINAVIDGAGLADIISHTPVTIKLTSNAGFVITSTLYSISGVQLLADFNVPLWADNGFYKLSIISGSGCYSLNNSVQVNGGTPPAILSINPSQGLRAQTLTALMTGSYTFFMPGTQSGGIQNVLFQHATTFNSFNVPHQNIAFIDSEHVNLNISIPANVPAGYYNVTVNRINNPALHLNPGFLVTGTVLSGSVYLDVDSNGTYNAGDIYLPNQRIQAMPDNVITFTNQPGNYNIGVEPGMDTILVIPDSGWINTNVSSYILNVGPNDTSGFDFGVRPIIDEFDVLLDQTSGFPRCNQNVNTTLTLKNNSTNVIDAVLWWLPDTSISVVSNNPAPAYTNGDTLFWTVTGLLVQHNFTVHSVVHMPGPGISLHSYSCVTAAYNGNTVAASCDSLIQIIGCAFDPNDKTAEPEGMFPQHYVLGADYLTYLIRFQNTGNDTAFNVSIFDTLNSSFELSTLELVASSNPVSIYLTGHVVEFRFTNILLPDSNVNELMSHGFVKFRIKPSVGYIDGTPVTNQASIHFDLNSPVITNTVMNTIVSQIPLVVRELPSGNKELILYPNPTNGLLNVRQHDNKQINGSVYVLDQTGRILKLLKINSDKGEINLGNYPAGIYTVVVVNKDGVERGRVVVY